MPDRERPDRPVRDTAIGTGDRLPLRIRSFAAAGIAAVLPICVCVAMLLAGGSFVGPVPAADMPILLFSTGLALAAAIAVVALPHAARSPGLWLGMIFLIGITLRCVLLFSAPILEADFNRYLWDGGLSAHGFNPYALSPSRIGTLPYDDPRLELSKAAGAAFDGISYPDLKTIYPPVAQAMFALAHLLAPWSLTTWRTICIVGDVVTFVLIVKLLEAYGRSPTWAVLYWWNPLVLKEIVNSAHLEAVLMPMVLGALYLTVRGRSLFATGALALAIGTKLWPVMLAPLILRPLLGNSRRLAVALGSLVGAGLLFLLPVWRGGIDATSGFVAFADQWTTNSALFPMLERIAAMLFGVAPGPSPWPGRVIRGVSAIAVLALAIHLARAPLRDARDIVRRAYLIVTALLLLSPAQFPWYVLWVLPLATIHPGRGWHVATASLALYYTAFHFQARGQGPLFDTWIVWLIWAPIWIALSADIHRNLAARQSALA